MIIPARECQECQSPQPSLPPGGHLKGFKGAGLFFLPILVAFYLFPPPACGHRYHYTLLSNENSHYTFVPDYGKCLAHPRLKRPHEERVGSSHVNRGEEGAVVTMSPQIWRGDQIQIKPPAQAGQALTVSEALDRWVRIRSRCWSPAYRVNVIGAIKAWLDILPPINLALITTLHVEELYACRDNGSRGKSWLNTERAYLRSFWRWAQSHRLVDHDPTTAWPRFRKIKIQRKYHTFSREQEDALCQAVLDPANWRRLEPRKRRAIVKYIRVAIGTALRKSTIYSLRWAHLSAAGILEVPGELDKTGENRRIPLPSRLIEILGPRGRDDEPLIPNLPHKKNLNVYLKKVSHLVGVDPSIMSPHQFRRSFVGRLHNQGVPLGQVMQVGGWKSLSVVLKHYYTGISDHEAREILEKL